MKHILYTIWIGIGLVVSAIWSGDDLSDNESAKIAGAGGAA